MKARRTFLALVLIHLFAVAHAQSFHVYMGNLVLAGKASQTETLPFKNSGSSLQIGDTLVNISDIDSILVSKQDTTTAEVEIAYDGNGARVVLPVSLASTVKAEISGAYVTITSVADGGQDIVYTLSGKSEDGSFKMIGSYKCKVRLKGLTLNSTRGAAIDIQNGKRIDVVLEDGTTNTLSDAPNGTQKACFFVKGHPEFSSGGTLNIIGRSKHALSTNEYIRFKKSTGTICINEAASDAIHCGQYFNMEGGTLIVGDSVKGDGVQAEVTKDNTDEFNGQMFIKGGSITMTINGDDVKGLKSDSAITITGGTIDITANGAGTRGISCGGNLEVNESDTSTSITVRANGGVYTNPLDETDTSKCMGIRVEGDMTVSAGTITVTATGKKAKTIKVVGRYTKTGTAVVNAANMDI